MARERISLSRWNVGEISPRAIGDFDQPLFKSSCRFLNNFVVSESGKAWRRPGFVHHAEVTESIVRLVPLYLRDTTIILMFYLDGTHPTQVLKFKPFHLVSGKFVEGTAETVYTFKSDDFSEDRPNTVDLHRLSYVQVESVNQIMYVTHPNMEDPRTIEYDVSTQAFTVVNYSAATSLSYYWDVYYDSGTSKWNKEAQVDLATGGGTADPSGDAGWTPFTGEEFLTPRADNYANPQVFKYLTAVTFAFQRLVWVRGSYYLGSGTGDPENIGFQYRNQSVSSAVEPFTVLASDPFLYRVSSDLGFEDIQWLASGSLLLGGANNGAWVLSNTEAGGLDATNPLAYKSSSNGCHWVPGKTIGDSLVFFQRPGRQLNEFLFANASQNYVATNLSEYSDHLFYDETPVEMSIQRSPFNVAWVLREDGTLISFTYDRVRQIYGWARHEMDSQIGTPVPLEGGSVNSLAMFTDGVTDRPVIHVTRENADGVYHAIELMDFYTPNQIDGVFVDSAAEEILEGPADILSITADAVNGHWIFYDDTSVTFADNDILRVRGATRTDDGVQDIADNHYDYIYGVWTVFDHDAVNGKFRIKDQTGEPYKGISDVGLTANSYILLGSAEVVTKNPLVASRPDYSHLAGVYCRALLDGNPYYIYVSADGNTFYNADTIPDDWGGVESELDELGVFWNKIIIGRGYQSLWAPFILKKQVNKGKITEIEVEVFRSLGGKVGTARVTLDDVFEDVKTTDLIYPALFEDDRLYTGTLKPRIVGGYADDPFWFVLVEEAVPFNLTNVIYSLEVN